MTLEEAHQKARDAASTMKRRNAILDMWADGKKLWEIGQAVGGTPQAVSMVISRARCAGDPRALGRRYDISPAGLVGMRAQAARARAAKQEPRA